MDVMQCGRALLQEPGHGDSDVLTVVDGDATPVADDQDEGDVVADAFDGALDDASVVGAGPSQVLSPSESVVAFDDASIVGAGPSQVPSPSQPARAEAPPFASAVGGDGLAADQGPGEDDDGFICDGAIGPAMLKASTWGAFRIMPKQPGQAGAGPFGGFQAACPFHRKSKQTLCKKWVSILGGGNACRQEPKGNIGVLR
jgi:hypothetical protein